MRPPAARPARTAALIALTAAVAAALLGLWANSDFRAHDPDYGSCTPQPYPAGLVAHAWWVTALLGVAGVALACGAVRAARQRRRPSGLFAAAVAVCLLCGFLGWAGSWGNVVWMDGMNAGYRSHHVCEG